MKFHSTRQVEPKYELQDILFRGTSQDGGLFVPERIPKVDPKMITRYKDNFPKLSHYIVNLFTDNKRYPLELFESAYSWTRGKIPITPINDKISIAELFHGPSCSFKDYALQLIAQIVKFECGNKNTADPHIILTATSGDTGSAVIEAFKDIPNIKVIVLFARNISQVQKNQMVTGHPSVIPIEIDGSFDQCQRIVKQCFQANDLPQLTSMNSINILRIIAQIPYYFYICNQVSSPTHQLTIAVPTGNFGNALAGYYAQQMGADFYIDAVTNENDNLYMLFNKGHITSIDVVETITPAMDIQLSSNVERYIYHNYGASATSEIMKDSPYLRIGPQYDPKLKVYRAEKQEIIETIQKCENTYLLDPHTAAAVAAETHVNFPNTIVLGTAHPAKFPSYGNIQAEHPKLSNLTQQGNYVNCQPDLEHIKNIIRNTI